MLNEISHIVNTYFEILPFYKRIFTRTKTAAFSGQNHGADDQSRTGDLILTKDALYLLSYISKASGIILDACKNASPQKNILLCTWQTLKTH